MASDQEKAHVKEMIQAPYQLANIPKTWDLDVNDGVAEVFGVMLSETRKCSNSSAFTWVPKPPLGRASISWLAMQLGRSVFNRHKGGLSATCARVVIGNWGRALQMASLGVSSGVLPRWA
jgi:hypothetical protein